MPTINKPFVIILNDHLNINKSKWSYVHEDVSLRDAKLHQEFDEIIGTVPRSSYNAEKIESIDLIYTVSGDKFYGAIYKLVEKQ